MGTGIQLCIVGAGSSYTPELIEGILAHAPEPLPITDVRLHDIDADRLAVMAGLAERMVRHAGKRIEVRAGTALAPLVEGADFVITQIRVGGMAARYLDESIPPRYGLLGQETTGPGGMFKALRTIPPMLAIARTVEQVAPRAFLLNYTNPSGIVTEALRRHTGARVIGLCSGIPEMQTRLRDLLRGEFGDLRSYCVGLNHLGFVHRLEAGGRDVTATALERVVAHAEQTPGFGGFPDPRSIRLLHAISLGYLSYYLFRRQTLETARTAGQTRAQQIMRIEEEVFAEARSPAATGKPAALAKRGGGGYSNITLGFLRAIVHDSGDELACTVRNGEAVDGIEPDAGVEVVCRTGANGPAPLPVGPIPLAFRGLVQAVKAYETLTVAAAVQQSRALAIQALVNHPLAGDLDVIEPLVDEMLQAHGLCFR